MQSSVTVPQTFQDNWTHKCNPILNSTEIKEIKLYQENENKLQDSINPSTGAEINNEDLSAKTFQADQNTESPRNNANDANQPITLVPVGSLKNECDNVDEQKVRNIQSCPNGLFTFPMIHPQRAEIDEDTILATKSFERKEQLINNSHHKKILW